MSDKKTHCMAGMKLFGEGEHAKAIDCFTEALASIPISRTDRRRSR